jgi:hypothetical protein
MFSDKGVVAGNSPSRDITASIAVHIQDEGLANGDSRCEHLG